MPFLSTILTILGLLQVLSMRHLSVESFNPFLLRIEKFDTCLKIRFRGEKKNLFTTDDEIIQNSREKNW